MDTDHIKQRIREIITNVTNIPGDRIGCRTAFVDELDLDSLALLEIGVDIDFAFKLNLPDERFKELTCLEDAVRLVEGELASRAATSEVHG
jgi:acyl carrier protein